MYFRKYSHLLCAFLLLMAGIGQAQQQPRIAIQSPDFEKVALSRYAWVLADTLHQWQAEDLLEAPGNYPFIPSGLEKPNYGYTDVHYWLYFELENTSSSNIELWIEVDYPLLDSLHLWVRDKKKKTEHFVTGDRLPFKSRPMKYKNFVFPVELAAGEQKQFLFRISSEGTVSFPVYAWAPVAFAESSNTTQIGFGIYYGIMLVMAVYNLFLFFSLGDRNYLFYVLNILAIILFQLSFNGLGYQYLWAPFPAFHHISVPLFIALLTLTSLNFTYHFLEIRRQPHWMKYILWGGMLLALCWALMSVVMPYRLSIKLTTVTALLMTVVIFATAVYVYRKGYAPAKFFLLAWGIFLLGALLSAMRGYGWMPNNFVTTYAVQIGSAMEVVLLSFGLAYRINLLKQQIAAAALERERLEKEKEREQKEFIEVQNRKLEQLVAERTAEIEKQNRDIRASIQYAEKIQRAILPAEDAIKRYFPDSFVLFKPRDIVSGDFYWFSERDGKLFLAAVDCTGHGVPGAFMSMIGYALLNQIVNEREVDDPGEVLLQLHKEIRKALKQEEDSVVRDGMDVAFCMIDTHQGILHFAGAARSLYYTQKGMFHEIKGAPYSVGGFERGRQRIYPTHSISLKDNMMFFLTTDGFADQFGGERDRKFMVKNFKRLLQEVAGSDYLALGKQTLQQVFEQWKGSRKQVDDVLVIGLKVEKEVFTKYVSQNTTVDVY